VQGIDFPTPASAAGTALPPAQQRLARRPRLQATEHAYALPPDTSGQATGRQAAGTAASDGTATSAASAAAVAAEYGQTPTAAYDAPATTGDTAEGTAAPVAAECGHTSTSTLPVPRTTPWRHRRRLKDGAAPGRGPPPLKEECKQYSCRICGATYHQEYYGQCYCPSATNLSYDDWLKEAKTARAAKHASQTSIH